MTPVYYQIHNHLDREYKALDRDKITYWLFHFKNGIDIDDCRGGRISLTTFNFAALSCARSASPMSAYGYERTSSAGLLNVRL